jgi:hypothetical protein
MAHVGPQLHKKEDRVQEGKDGQNICRTWENKHYIQLFGHKSEEDTFFYCL